MESGQQQTELYLPALTAAYLAAASILCFVTPVPGFILGIWSVYAIRRSNGRLSGFGLAWFGIIGSLVLGCVQWCLLTTPGVHRKLYVCETKLHEQARAMQLYAEDYSHRLPLAANWCDSAKPRSTGSVDFQTCPSLPKGQKGGYAFNSALSSHKIPIAAESNLVLIFESDPGWNRYGQQEILLREPRYDHGNGFAFAFADGHAKWIGKSKTGAVIWNSAQAAQSSARREPGDTR